MGLDTRGFMDGALRGYDLMERHYDRQDRKEDRQHSLRMADEAKAENQRRYDADQQRLAAQDKQNEEHYQTEQKRVALRDAQRAKVDAAQTNYYTERNEQAKRQQSLKDSMVLLDAGWQKWQQTGEIDPIFDEPYVKNSAYDIRRYTPDVLTAFKNIEVNMPKVLYGAASPDSLVADLDAIYRPNLDVIVGTKDASGKVIASTKLARVSHVADIYPNRAGKQPGLALGMEVFYEDGTSGGIRPVTKNRSTDKDDTVMEIPLESAMQDLTGQLGFARKAAASPYHQKLFGSQRQDDGTAAIEKEYRGEVNKANKWYADTYASIAEASQGPVSPEQQQTLDSQYQAMIGRIDQNYGKHQPQSNDGSGKGEPKTVAADQWANDANKQMFVKALGERGFDLSTVTPEMLDAAYTSELEQQKIKQFAADAEGLRNHM